MSNQGVIIRLWGVLWIIVATAVVAQLFLLDPWLDVQVANHFMGRHGWLFASNPVSDFFDDYRRPLLLVLALLPLGALVLRHRQGLRFWDVPAAVASMVLANALVANVIFKGLWGRARPRDLALFGGDAAFTPAWVPADQCTSNCSFIAGDVAFIVSIAAIVLLFPAGKRLGWSLYLLVIGLVVSFLRMAVGAQFLSDTIFAVLITMPVVLLVDALRLNYHRRHRPNIELPPPEADEDE
jgi:lipid A 4'-phosphatase